MGKYFNFVNDVGTKGSDGGEPDFKGEPKEGQNPTIKQHENSTRMSVSIGGSKPIHHEPVDPFVEQCKSINLKRDLLKGLFNKLKK